MLKILVCVKQVPDVNLVKIDPVTGSLIRDGVPAIMNPLDGHALEAAVQLKETYGGEITAVTMGPDAAMSVLRECVSVGAERAILLSDYAFKDADTLSTSYTIEKGASMFGKYDIILCGKETLDGATGQMGSQLAERFGTSFVSSAALIESVDEKAGVAIVERETEYGVETVEAKLPVLMTIEKTNYQPRIPNFKGKKFARTFEITKLTSETIEGLDKAKIGAPGSGTIVPRTYPPEKTASGVMIDEGDSKKNVAKVMEIMADKGLV